jgi:MFS family permease
MSTDVKSPPVDRIDLAVPARVGLLLTAGLPAFAAGGLAPILPAIAAHFADYANIRVLTRLMLSIIGIAIIIGSPAMGMLADRYGRRTVLLAGLMLYALVGSAGFFLDNPYAILAARICVGFATAAAGTMILAIIASQTQGQARNRWLGYLNTAGTICALILIPLSGFVGKLGWQWPFLIHAIALPLFVLVMTGLPADKPAATAAASAVAPPFNVRELPWFLLVFAIACGVVAMTTALYLPFHLTDMGIGDPRSISFALTMMTFGTAVSSLLYGAVRARFSLNATFALGFGVSAVGLTIVSTAANYTAVLIGQGVSGFGFAIVAISLYAYAAQTGSESHRARTMGIAKGGLYAGPLVGQAILEPLVSRAGSAAPLYALAGAAFVLFAIYAGRLLSSAPERQGT